MTTPSPRPPETRIELTDAVVQYSQVSVNVGQDFIATTKDKLELILLKYQDALRAKHEWIAPAGILLAVLPTLLGAQFTDFLSLKKEVWEALYLIAALGSLGWLAASIVRSYRTRESRGVACVINRIRRAQPEADSTGPPGAA
jgi:hypothetical protein